MIMTVKAQSLLDIAGNILYKSSSLTQLSSTSDEALANAFVNVDIQNDPDLINACEELLLNGREHGKENVSVFLEKEGHIFIFAIRDFGDGIHQTIPRNPRLKDTSYASASKILNLACEQGVSGTGDPGRGVGLYELTAFCEKRQADALIMSDSATLIFNKQKSPQILSRPDIKGTLVILKVKVT